MSGGSFDYLYCADDLDARVGDIERMARTLEERGHADAAARTREVVQHLKAARTIRDELEQVWREVEWWQSCDTLAEDADAAVERWRKQRSG